MAKFVVTAKKDGKSVTRTVTADSKKAAKKKVSDAGYEVEDIRSQEEGLEELDDSTAATDNGEVEIISVEEVEDDDGDGEGDDDGSSDDEGDAGSGEGGEDDASGSGKDEGEGDDEGDGADDTEDEIEPSEQHWWFK